jgi:hypothetical protein
MCAGSNESLALVEVRRVRGHQYLRHHHFCTIWIYLQWMGWYHNNQRGPIHGLCVLDLSIGDTTGARPQVSDYLTRCYFH